MSLLTHQSAINSDKNFWVKAEPGISTSGQFVKTEGGSVMDYLATLNFATMPGAVSTVSLYGSGGALYIESENQGINFLNAGDSQPKVQINTDANATNGYAGVFVSTTVVAGAGFQTGGNTPNGITYNHRNSAGDVIDYYRMYLPLSDNSYGSTIGFLNYASKDGFNFNNTTSPIYQINPYTSSFTFPTYTVNVNNTIDAGTVSANTGTFTNLDHPGVAKAFGVYTDLTGAGPSWAPLASYNMGSATRTFGGNGTGDYEISFTTPFNTSSIAIVTGSYGYPIGGSPASNSAGVLNYSTIITGGNTATGIRLTNFTSDNKELADSGGLSVSVYSL